MVKNKIINSIKNYIYKNFELIVKIITFNNLFLSNICLSKKETTLLVQSLYFIGTLSLGIIISSALFIGMVVGLQGNYMINGLGIEYMLGKMSSLTIVRELGPVVSTLLFVGRTCSSITAEICLMKITDQLSAIEVMGISVFKKIMVPRFIASIISLNLLNMIFILFAIIGSYISSVYIINIDSDVFWNSIGDSISFREDILNSMLKSLLFSLIVTYISIFQGFNSKSTIESIGMSTTNTVVYSTLLVLILNFLLTSIMF